MVSADFEQPGDADLVRKLLGGPDGGGVEMSERRLRTQMERCLVLAKETVM